VAGIGVGKVVDLSLKGLAYLARKTDTTKDDRAIAFLQEHAPDLVELFTKTVVKPGAKPAPRELTRDHRGPLN